MYLWAGEGGRRGGGGLERGGWNLYCTGTVRILTVPVNTVIVILWSCPTINLEKFVEEQLDSSQISISKFTDTEINCK
jgi:hypothetical protein